MGKQKTAAESVIAVRVGARIRHLREIQHISQIQLATDIGIRAGPLGWIEKGKHLPSGRVLYRLAKQLNVKIDDLFEEQDVWQVSAATSERVSSFLLPPLDVTTGNDDVKSAHIICQSVADRLVDLERLCGAVRTAAVPLTVPFAPTAEGADYLASNLRQNLGIGHAVLTDYVGVLEDAGFRVVFINMPEPCTTFSGYDLNNRNAVFFVNSRLKKSPECQTYRLAFELGRVFWNMRKAGLSVTKEREKAVPEGVLGEAAFARQFAASFLMPAFALQAIVGQLGLATTGWTWELLLRLKKRFGVSAQEFAMRAKALGLTMSEKQKKTPGYYLFKDEIQAYAAENGEQPEPDGNTVPLMANMRLVELIGVAESKGDKQAKAVNSVKRALRQAGVRWEG